MSSDLAISVRDLGKKYRIARTKRRHTTLAEALLHKAKNPFEKDVRDEFWALSDLNFDIYNGDVVGIIGRNGAGKSTLLKVMSQITEPTTGEIKLWGRVGSLLEVGTGFHPELTGRENIFLNGSILGMTRREIQREFDAIVEFSGVEKFLETPVKRYSSGMYVRLAFSVAAHLSSEILVVDEVLAVGDAEFQRKCLGKMQDVARAGRTVLFVSHQIQSVATLCSKAMFLEKGHLGLYGSVQEGIDRYIASLSMGQDPDEKPERRKGTGEIRFNRFATIKENVSCDEVKEFRFSFRKRQSFAGKVFIQLHLVDAGGIIVAQCDSRLMGAWYDGEFEGEIHFAFRTPWLKPGSYRINALLCSSGVLDKWDSAAQIHVMPLLPYPVATGTQATSQGIVFGDYSFSMQEEELPQIENLTNGYDPELLLTENRK